MTENSTIRPGLDLAIIGMSGKFPGAAAIDEFWQNLRDGVESIAFFSPGELRDAGIADTLMNSPGYIPAKGYLEDIDGFDAAFFGYTPVEAESMEPQIRLFHETVWSALEDAGYIPGSYPGLIALYGGATDNAGWQISALFDAMMSGMGGLASSQLSDKDHLCARISYKLDLKGPVFSLSTQCSTSLVAFHLACQALLSGECDMALAGGVSVTLPQKDGHSYQEGMVYSSDGHCRAFDSRASGTIFGNGSAAVVVKRAEDAIEAGDHIHALVKGSAVNNDGSRRVGYTAPGVEGQVEVIRAAHMVAEIQPEDILYVETHGTGTTLGDPIEIQALTEAFDTGKRAYCAIGSVKSNVGHLDAAAGVTSLIKAVQILVHRMIPPSLHLETPNPAANFSETPFYVNNKLNPLETGENPPLVCVSSFGIGGTNAHVVLQEAPPLDSDPRNIETIHGGYRLLPVSARTPEALDQSCTNLSSHLQTFHTSHPIRSIHPTHPGSDIFDIAYTLQTGRKEFSHRSVAVCSTIEEAARTFSSSQEESGVRSYTIVDEDTPPRIVFMFSGQGDQYIDMGLDLYKHIPLFRETMDQGFAILDKLLGPVKWIVYPGLESPPASPAGDLPGRPEDLIKGAVYSGPVKFIFDYAMARLLMHWGIHPQVMIGHSFGEYTAACLSEVFSMEDALKLVVLRGQLMETLPPGTMLSVTASEQEINRRLAGNPGAFGEISIAAVNGPSLCIVAGPTGAVDQLAGQMTEDGFECIRIHFPRGSHSGMMDPILAEFESGVRKITLNPPRIPYYSSVTGKLISASEATDPAYWARHMRRTVRFRDGIVDLIHSAPPSQPSIFIQVGAGRGLTMFLGLYPEFDHNNVRHIAINVLRNRKEETPDTRYLMERLGDMWLSGLTVHWEALYPPESVAPRRVSIPTYPFEHRKYRKFTGGLGALLKASGGRPREEKREDISTWFYAPCWQPAAWPNVENSTLKDGHWLIFMDETGFGERLSQYLKNNVIRVSPGDGFSEAGPGRYIIDPKEDSHYKLLIQTIRQTGEPPDRIFHLWGLGQDGTDNDPLSPETVRRQMEMGYYSLSYLAKYIDFPVKIGVVTSGVQVLDGYDRGPANPGKATVLSPVRIIPSEIPGTSCFTVDIPEPLSTGSTGPEESLLMRRLLAEFHCPSHLFTAGSGPVSVYRGGKRFIQNLAPAPLTKPRKPAGSIPRIREQGVYLVVGGLGGVGLTQAVLLASKSGVKLALLSRSGLPEDPEHKVHEAIRNLENSGSRVLVCKGDVSDPQQMERVKDRILEQLGPVNGIIHSAMVVDGAVIGRRTQQWEDKILGPKVTGTLVLDEVFAGQPLDFFILNSSIASYNNSTGETGYCAGSIFQDTYAVLKNLEEPEGPAVVSINWDAWQEVGQTVRSVESLNKRYNKDFSYILAHGIRPAEGADATARILGLNGEFPSIAVYTRDISALYRNNRQNLGESEKPEQTGSSESLPVSQKPATGTAGIRHKRPQLKTPYEAPSDDVEKALADIWAMFFGYERVGILDDFFQLGGDSLKATMVITRIQRQLNVRVPLMEFFEGATIQNIARYIDGLQPQSPDHVIPAAEKREYYPLSSVQKRLYILQQLNPQSLGYNETMTALLEGELDTALLEQVFRQLILRHESLRTSFLTLDSGFVQKIVPPDRVDFSIKYFENPLPQSSKQEEENQRIIRDFIYPFEFSAAPLLRVGLIRNRGNRHVLVVDMPHIITDGVSIGILIDEFMTLWTGKTPVPLTLQYKDYATWWSGPLGRERADRQQEFWLAQFAEEPPELYLPLDFPRPPVLNYEGAVIDFNVGVEETRTLKTIASERDLTPYMMLLGIFNVMLAKLSNQEDIVTGTVVAGRQNQGFENVMGMFVNTLALRNNPAGDLRFSAFLAQLKKNTLAALDNQEYPFEKLVEQVAGHRHPGRNPVFDTAFTFQDLHGPKVEARNPEPVEIPGLRLMPYQREKTVSKFDLTFHGYDAGEDVMFTAEYSVALFKKETIRRFIVYFKRIIKELAGIIDGPVRDIDILSTGEKEELLRALDFGPSEFPRDKTIHQLFREQVARTPGNIALETAVNGSNMTNMTYEQLDLRSNDLARRLREQGACPGDIVALKLIRSFEMIEAILAVLKAGAAYLPIDPAYPEERVNFMLKDSNAKLVLDQSQMPLTGQGAGSPLERATRRVDPIIPHSGGVFLPGDAAYIIYTSGTTGRPKGSVIEHRNVVRLMVNEDFQFDFNHSDVWTLFHSYCFDFSVWEMYGSLLYGGKLVIVPAETARNPGAFLDLLEHHGVTVLNQTPSAFYNLSDREAERPEANLDVRYVIFGGEALSPARLANWRNRYPETKLINMYGITETTVHVTFKEVTAGDIEANGAAVGGPIPGLRILILDRHLRLCPPGVAGECCVAGDGVGRGYLNRPELTAERFINHATPSNLHLSPTTLYRSGDLMRLGTGGQLEYLGRIDQQVKVRGFRIELGEIENRLLGPEFPAIAKAAVLAEKDAGAEGTNILSAYIVLNKNEELPVTRIRDGLSRHLPDYMIPAHFFQVERIPLTPNGKLDRHALLAMGKKLSSGVKFTPPASETEKQVASAWQEVLNIKEKDALGMDDNFFEVGGNSVNIVALATRLRTVLGIDIPLVKLFLFPTISSFTRFYEQEIKTGSAAKVAGPEQTIDEPAIQEPKLSKARDRLKQRRNKK